MEEMMKKIQLIVATVFVSLTFSNWAIGQTKLPLNTGFNHATGSVYQVGAQDDYWINIATAPTPTPAAGRSNVIQWAAPWVAPLPPFNYPVVGPIPGTNWISAWPTIGGHVNPVTGKGYSIFQKCFCMMSFTQPRLEFHVRADDNILVYLNDIQGSLLTATPGGYGSAVPIHVVTTNPALFKIGVNCLYVYLEDTGGWMGFDLRGYVSAYGLMPVPATGLEISFAPCGCDFSARPGTRSAVRAEIDTQKIIQEILKAAEARRTAKGKPATR